jgi:hypothetical protein
MKFIDKYRDLGSWVMKRNKYVLYAVLVAGVVLIITGLVSLWAPESLKLIEERKPVDPYNAMTGHIKEARGIALQLERFTWDEFSAIGLEAPPSELCKIGDTVTTKESSNPISRCKWISLPDMLPRSESAGTLVLYCDTCLKMAERVRLERPLDNAEELYWLELCRQLRSTLKGAAYLATNYKNTNDYIITRISDSISNSDPALKQKYLGKFENKSARYLSSLEELANNLEEAEQSLLQLTNGKLDGEAIPEENTEL